MEILGYTISGFFMVLFGILWIAFAFWPATVAKNKGSSFWGFFIFSLFFFVIALIVALVMPDKRTTQTSPPTETQQ